MAEVTVGQVLGGRFAIQGVLGRGGTATVYLAEDRLRGERIALKALHPHLAQSPSMRQRLQREVQTASRLRHPAALVAHEVHALDGVHALALPYHPGRTLAEAVASAGGLSEPDLVILGRRLAEALAEAHTVGVLHRDVSPGNVLLLFAEDAVLTDFGTARVSDLQARSTQALMGTAGYAAPEVYEGARGDPRSDLYGLGAVLYLAAGGTPPFAASTPLATLRRQLEADQAPLRRLRPDLGEATVAVIEALLAPDPADRPQTAGEVADALREGRPPQLLGPRHEACRDHLPRGTFAVEVRPDGDTRPLELADAVGREAGLPKRSLSAQSPDVARCLLVRGVDEAVAERLVRASARAGYAARTIDLEHAPEPLALVVLAGLAMPAWLLGLAWWSGFADLDRLAALLAFSGLFCGAGAWVWAHSTATTRRPRRLGAYGVLYGEDLRPCLTPKAVGLLPPPTGGEEVEDVVDRSRGERLRARVQAQLRALEEALEQPEVPEVVRVDLRGVVARLSDQASALGRRVDALELELEQCRDAESLAELAWVEQRLGRLDALQRAGETVDVGEHARLMAARDAHEANEAGAARLEEELTLSLARLLEIANGATSARRSLLDANDAPTTAELVVEHLARRAELAGALSSDGA